MIVCDINNPRVIRILEDFRYNFFVRYPDRSLNTCMFESMKDERDLYTGNLWLDKIIGTGQDHAGAADVSYAYALKPDHYQGKDLVKYTRDFARLDNDLTTELGLQRSALSMMYPPGGFIGWHNNADAPGYNVIFTYSETGDGWFSYIDPATKEQVTIQDKPGWSLKGTYFGSYEDDCVVYHCASTNCWRMTLSYILGSDVDYWRDALYHIESFE